jgi:hypothetical protein
MKTRLQKIFDKRAREFGFGGLFDESRVKPPFNQLYLHHQTRFKSHIQSIERIRPAETRLRIEMDFADSPKFNAFAFPHNDQYFVGVPFGTVLILNDLYLRIMASQDVLLQIGEPTSQPKPALLDCILATADGLPTTADNPLGLSVGPTDPIREAYADYLIQIAFEFLFAHEYQHIEGGHLNWILNRGRRMICEYWSDKLQAEETLDKQVLEIDADAAAIRWSLKITMDKSNDHWRVPPALADLLTIPENRLGAWLFATGALFRLMDEIGCTSGHFSQQSHPPALMRSYFCLPAASYILGGLPLTHGVLDLLPLATGEVDLAFRSIAHAPPKATGIGDALSAEYPVHINRIIGHWPRVRAELSPIAARLGGSNAPDEYFELIP